MLENEIKAHLGSLIALCKRGSAVDLIMNGGDLELRSVGEHNPSCSFIMDAQGQDFKGRFNARYLLDFFKHNDSLNVWIGINDKDKDVITEPVILQGSTETEHQYIIAPLALKD